MGGAWQSDDLRPVPADRRIFCKIEGRDHGIGWQCEELERRGLRATFFCEVLSSLVLGDPDTRSYMEFLLQRGQDVQLHAHPNFYFYSQYRLARERGGAYDHSQRSDRIGSLPLPLQRQLLELSRELFHRFTGRRPVAFRAGGYQANSATLSILSELGFLLDGSYNPAFREEGSFPNETLLPNVPQKLQGIWEVPVAVAQQDLPDPRKTTSLMPFELSAISLPEIRCILDHAHQSGLQHVVAIFHSFSAVKAKDHQYSQLRPDSIVRRRFTGTLDYLATHSERFEVSTFEALGAQVDQLQPAPAPKLAHLGYLRPFGRLAVQAVNRSYWL